MYDSGEAAIDIDHMREVERVATSLSRLLSKMTYGTFPQQRAAVRHVREAHDAAWAAVRSLQEITGARLICELPQKTRAMSPTIA